MAIKSYRQPDGEKVFEVYVNTADSFGRRVQIRKRGFKSLKEARNQEFEIKRQVANQREERRFTFSEWHKICIERMSLEMRPSTLENYECRLKKWVSPKWDNVDLKSITPGDIHDLVFRTDFPASDHSRKTILKMVKRVLQMALEENLITNNPAVKIKVKVAETKQAVLNATEVNILLKEARATNHRFYEVWAVAVFTGMRSGELYALRWSDLDLENNRISVTRSWCSKAGFGPTKCAKNRVVPISQELRRLLLEMKMRRNPDSEFVLPHLPEWTIGGQALVLREFCNAVGITNIKFHDLRATFITQLLLRGVPLAQVMSIVGHSQLKTTNLYLRVAGADLEGATDKLSFSLPLDQVGKIIDFGARK